MTFAVLENYYYSMSFFAWRERALMVDTMYCMNSVRDLLSPKIQVGSVIECLVECDTYEANLCNRSILCIGFYLMDVIFECLSTKASVNISFCLVWAHRSCRR